MLAGLISVIAVWVHVMCGDLGHCRMECKYTTLEV